MRNKIIIGIIFLLLFCTPMYTIVLRQEDVKDFKYKIEKVDTLTDGFILIYYK